MSKLREILNILDEKTKAEIIDELLILSDNNLERVANIVDPGYIQRMGKAEEKKVKKIIIDNTFVKFPDYSKRINSDFYIGEEKVKKEVYDDLEEKGIIPDLTKYRPVEKKRNMMEPYPIGTAFRLKEGTFTILSTILNSKIYHGYDKMEDYYWCLCVDSNYEPLIGKIRAYKHCTIEDNAEILD